MSYGAWAQLHDYPPSVVGYISGKKCCSKKIMTNFNEPFDGGGGVGGYN